jgi:hypothetical protein
MLMQRRMLMQQPRHLCIRSLVLTAGVHAHAGTHRNATTRSSAAPLAACSAGTLFPDMPALEFFDYRGYLTSRLHACAAECTEDIMTRNDWQTHLAKRKGACVLACVRDCVDSVWSCAGLLTFRAHHKPTATRVFFGQVQ